MQCPSCGANVDTAYCTYCGSKMPAEAVETQTIHAENVVVHNHYYQGSQEQASGQSQHSQSSYSSTQQHNNPAPAFGGYNTYTGQAHTVYALPVSPKSRMIALLLCFFLGFFGAHRIYAGRYLMGIVYFFTIGLFGFGWLVDLIFILCGRMRDGNGLPITNW